MMPALIAGVSWPLAQSMANSLLDAVGMGHRKSHLPSEMSGGDQQRTAIARSLVMRPKLLLADELTGNLDSKNSEKVATLLKNLASDFGATLLVVTHDDKVASFFPRKIVIEDGQIIG
jgi:ABC-type lipoprotein export system ATPase subunit